MALASCSKHLTHEPGCLACETAEQARRTRKETGAHARQAQRDIREQNRLIAEQTAAQEEGNRLLAEQSALHQHSNRLLAQQNALLAKHVSDEAAFRWSMWLQSPDGQQLQRWVEQRTALTVAMNQATEKWRSAWARPIAATEGQARSDIRPAESTPPHTSSNLSVICFYVGVLLLIAWIVAQFHISLAVIWRLLITVVIIVVWAILIAILPEDGQQARQRYDHEQEMDLKRRRDRRTGELLTARYGLDPRGTSPWVGGPSVGDVERFTQSQVQRAASTYRLPDTMDMPSLTLREWHAPMPDGVRDALRLLAPWAVNPPQESRAQVASSPSTDPRQRHRARARYLIEVMARYEQAWVRAWDGHSNNDIDFDPQTSAPWVGPARSTDLEDALETDDEPPLPILVLREPDERWPVKAQDLIKRILDDDELPADAPSTSSPPF